MGVRWSKRILTSEKYLYRAWSPRKISELRTIKFGEASAILRNKLQAQLRRLLAEVERWKSDATLL